MPGASSTAYLTGKGLSWASGSLASAGRSRPSLRSRNQLDVFQIFVPGLKPSAAGFSTALTKHYRQQQTLTGRRQVRFQSTETQKQTSSKDTYPPPQAKAPAVSYDGQSAGAPPKPPASISPLAVSTNTAAELGTPSNQTSASQTQLAEKKAAEAKELESKKPKGPLLTRIWAKVKEEALHYWHGSKLLGKEVKISSRLLRRLMLGYSLTRREKRQLKRTFADLLRLIPFVPFIIIPAGELLLPVAIKIFPNMLPSTFESKFTAEEKRRGLIKVRLEMAKFLQETIKEGGLQATDKVKTSEEFKEFFRKVRSTGEAPSKEDVIKVARLFEDDLTLDNLTRPQLVSVCRYMQINAFGTDNYLRYQIRHKLNRIRQDDIVISMEGVDNMSQAELVSACQSRGIQTTNLSEARLRQELLQWIELHVKNKISGTLLVLSKAFNYVAAGTNDDNESQSHLRSLELTLSSLPDNLVSEAELNVNKDGATNKQRLEVLQQQEELIEDEAEQEEEEAAAREADKERRNAEKARLAQEEEEARSLLPKQETHEEPEDARMTNEQLTELGEALSILSAKSSVLKEREELAQLIKEVNDPEMETSPAALAAESDTAEPPASSSTSSSTRSMTKRIKNMLKKIDSQLEEYDRDVGSRMNLIETSQTGKISVDDLGQALRLIKHKPDDEIIDKLVDKLDVDHDGLVPLDDVIELARAETGLGILRDNNVQEIHAQGKEIRSGEGAKPKKSDIVEN